MSVLSRLEQKEVSPLDKLTDYSKTLDRRRFVRGYPGLWPDQKCFVVPSPPSWSELRELGEVWSSPKSAFAAFVRSPTVREMLINSFQTIVDFVLILLEHAFWPDHHAALLIFRANLLKKAKLKVSSASADYAKLTQHVKYA